MGSTIPGPSALPLATRAEEIQDIDHAIGLAPHENALQVDLHAVQVVPVVDRQMHSTGLVLVHTFEDVQPDRTAVFARHEAVARAE